MVEIAVVRGAQGSARISLVVGPEPEVRDSVALDELAASADVPGLDNLVLDFDHYGRVVALRVTAAADSVLAPSLLDAASEL
jgi:hypothetical protein